MRLVSIFAIVVSVMGDKPEAVFGGRSLSDTTHPGVRRAKSRSIANSLEDGPLHASADEDLFSETSYAFQKRNGSHSKHDKRVKGQSKHSKGSSSSIGSKGSKGSKGAKIDDQTEEPTMQPTSQLVETEQPTAEANICLNAQDSLDTCFAGTSSSSFDECNVCVTSAIPVDAETCNEFESALCTALVDECVACADCQELVQTYLNCALQDKLGCTLECSLPVAASSDFSTMGLSASTEEANTVSVISVVQSIVTSDLAH